VEDTDTKQRHYGVQNLTAVHSRMKHLRICASVNYGPWTLNVITQQQSKGDKRNEKRERRNEREETVTEAKQSMKLKCA